MHKFLRAIGFSEITKKELDQLMGQIIERPMLQKVAQDSEGNEFAELSSEFGDFFGLSLRGTFHEDDSFDFPIITRITAEIGFRQWSRWRSRNTPKRNPMRESVTMSDLV